jgi:transcriptional regulator with XRE-family HTH domain
VSSEADDRAVDSIRFGRAIRAMRRRRRWRQEDLAAAAGVARATISRIELGQGDRHTVLTLEAVASTVGARVDVRLTWNGEGLDRLLDATHAGLVEVTSRKLESRGWTVAPEVSFAVYGERGSIDILAFHGRTATLLVVEVKSVVPDIQATLATLDRKVRLGPQVARSRGWTPEGTGRLLVIGADRTSRRRVAAHEATFRLALPVRGFDVDRWLRDPKPSPPFAGLRFGSGAHQEGTRHRIARRTGC